MKNVVKITDRIPYDSFPDKVANVEDLYNLMGLWEAKEGKDCILYMFCQVAAHTFAMVCIDSCNYSVYAFKFAEYNDDIVKTLKRYKRFKGSISITTTHGTN